MKDSVSREVEKIDLRLLELIQMELTINDEKEKALKRRRLLVREQDAAMESNSLELQNYLSALRALIRKAERSEVSYNNKVFVQHAVAGISFMFEREGVCYVAMSRVGQLANPANSPWCYRRIRQVFQNAGVLVSSPDVGSSTEKNRFTVRTRVFGEQMRFLVLGKEKLFCTV